MRLAQNNFSTDVKERSSVDWLLVDLLTGHGLNNQPVNQSTNNWSTNELISTMLFAFTFTASDWVVMPFFHC